MSTPNPKVHCRFSGHSRPILLGTCHRDSKGFVRTCLALSTLRPDCVLVELSPFAFAFRCRHHRFFRRNLLRHVRIACARLGIRLGRGLAHPEIRAIQSQLAFPFEYRAALEYCSRSGARLILVDHARFSRSWIRTWPELVSLGNCMTLLQLEKREANCADPYAAAAKCLHRDRGPIAGRTDYARPIRRSRDFIEREYYLARQVDRAANLFGEGHILYIGGWQHLSTGPSSGLSLATLLAPHNPRLLLLNQFSEASEVSSSERKSH